MMEVNSGKESKIERTKELIEMAVNAGRRLQSSQTGYIHHCYQSMDQDVQHTIPVYENILFVLALLRTRTVENVTEARGALERLLAFQNYSKERNGLNFPIYLHEFPDCWDHFLGIRLLAPFYWILKYYGHVLGNELKKKLEKSVEDLLIYGTRLRDEQRLTYPILVKFLAAKVAFGTLWNKSKWVEEEKVLKELGEQDPGDNWFSPEGISELLVGLQMVYPKVSESPWKPFWDYFEKTWNSNSCSYVGPNSKELQKKDESIVTLYDYFTGYFSGKYGSRTKTLNISQLKAALIHPSEDQLEDCSPYEMEGLYGKNKWHLRSAKEGALTLLQKQELSNLTLEKTFTPFHYVWGEGESPKIHSLICQNSFGARIEFSVADEKVDLFFYLEEGADLEVKERQREISFYLDFHSEVKFLVDGHSSNTFELGQKVLIQSGNKKIELVFDCLEGEGHFLGHISRGNRPSQIENKGEKRFQSYDWQIFIRTIRRKESCLLRTRILFI